MSLCEFICDSCSQPLSTAVNTGDQIHVTTCYHVYHYSCLWQMYTYTTQTNEWNEKIFFCVHPGCNRMILVSEISPAIDFSTSVGPHDDVQNDPRNQDTNYRILMLRDFNMCLQLSIVGLTNENSTLRAQAESTKREYADLMTMYNTLLDQVKNFISTGRQSSLPKPNNMLHLDNAPQPPPIPPLMNFGSFPAPATPQNSYLTQNSFGQRQFLPLQARPTLHHDRHPVGASASKQSFKIPDPPANPHRTHSPHRSRILPPNQEKGTSADKEKFIPELLKRQKDANLQEENSPDPPKVETTQTSEPANEPMPSSSKPDETARNATETPIKSMSTEGKGPFVDAKEITTQDENLEKAGNTSTP